MESATCIHGHPRTPENSLTWHRDGKPYYRCRVCQDIRSAKVLETQRAYRAANPLPPRVPKCMETLFWSKVEKTGTCWNWTGSKNSGGYGTITVIRDGIEYQQSNRASWLFQRGHIPDGLYALHECDNPSCVRIGPGHIYLGTAKQNAIDAVTRGRKLAMRGEKNGSARLSDAQAQQVRDDLSNGMQRKDVAARYGVSMPTIYRIIQGSRYIAGAQPAPLPRAVNYQRLGERHPGHVLTEGLVRTLRARYDAGTGTVRGMAREFGVSPCAVDGAVKRRTWRHVT